MGIVFNVRSFQKHVFFKCYTFPQRALFLEIHENLNGKIRISVHKLCTIKKIQQNSKTIIVMFIILKMICYDYYHFIKLCVCVCV